MSEPLPDYIPAPILYAHRIFNEMCEKAVEEEIFVPLQDEPQKLQVFTGSLTEIFDRSGASKGYYTEIRDLLMQNGSIVMLERGTARNPSKIAVRPDRSPPLRYEDAPNVKSRPNIAEISKSALTATDEAATLRVEVERLAARLGGINIVEALSNHEIRISRLENSNSPQTGQDGERTKDSQGTVDNSK